MAHGIYPRWETEFLLVVAVVGVGAAACLSVSAPVGLKRTSRR